MFSLEYKLLPARDHICSVQILVDGVNLLKIRQYLCNCTTYEYFAYFAMKLKVHLQMNIFIFRKVVEISMMWAIRILQTCRPESSMFALRDAFPLKTIHAQFQLFG